jgi:hypothetical protein
MIKWLPLSAGKSSERFQRIVAIGAPLNRSTWTRGDESVFASLFLERDRDRGLWCERPRQRSVVRVRRARVPRAELLLNHPNCEVGMVRLACF